MIKMFNMKVKIKTVLVYYNRTATSNKTSKDNFLSTDDCKK